VRDPLIPNGEPNRWQKIDLLARLFRDVGFPAIVALLLLWRLDATLGRLTDTIATSHLDLMRIAREMHDDLKADLGRNR